MFADDVKIYRSITTVTDCNLVQSDLDSLQVWCNNNKLFLNPNKCKVMVFSKQRGVPDVDYRICNNHLPLSWIWVLLLISILSLIGILIGLLLMQVGFVIRNTNLFSNIEVIKLLYFSLVRSRLEYASVIWSPHYANYSQEIEVIQNKFLKYLYLKMYGWFYPFDASVTEVRKLFNVPSLKLRRDFSCLFTLYKIIKNVVDCPSFYQNSIYMHQL